MKNQPSATKTLESRSPLSEGDGCALGAEHNGIGTVNDRHRHLLRERARLLALRTSTSRDDRPSTEFVTFRLAAGTYGIDLSHVVELQPLKHLMPLPCVPSFLPGLISVRGRVVPVLDLKYFFELPIDGLTDLHLAVVISGFGVEIGLLADTVLGIESIATDDVLPAVATLSDVRAEYCLGITAGGTVLLNPERILTDSRIVIDEKPSF